MDEYEMDKRWMDGDERTDGRAGGRMDGRM